MRGAQQRNGTGRVDRSTHRSSRVGPTRSTSVSGIAPRGCREQPGEPELAGRVREGGRSPRQPAPVSAHVRGTNQVDLRLKASARKVRLSSAARARQSDQQVWRARGHRTDPHAQLAEFTHNEGGGSRQRPTSF
uniref:(northern house mosquito) hypothetical protein n=1 Tax=Culex pipiens TaxID=7175 RepID=A0A8D8P8I1_CULPI